MTEHDKDQHAHRNLGITEEPLDKANQSLADALRASFKILKGIMMVLVVLYLFSNVRRVDSHEQALVLRLGSLRAGVHEPGLVWAFPFPIDEIVPLPATKSNDLLVDSHSFFRRREEVGKPLSYIARSPSTGLNPSLDGALLTADSGLVHVRWKITYKIDDVSSFVTRFVGDKIEAAEDLIRLLVETVGIGVALENTSEEMIRTNVHEVQFQIRRRVNERLKALNSGVTVTLVEMYEPTPPLQIRGAFDATQRSENNKKKRIDDAAQQETRILNGAAGAAAHELIEILAALDSMDRDAPAVGRLQERLDDVLMKEAEGEAGRLIEEASAYHSVVVGQMKSDVELYRTLLPEYEYNADMLIARLWEQAKQEIYNRPGVIKFYRPAGCEIRLKIPLDAEQARLDEERRLGRQGFDVETIRKEKRKAIPILPELE